MSEKNRTISVIIILFSIISGLIWVFTNFTFDEGYEIAMSYRLLNGDRPIVEMWEPNQTSIYVCASLMYVFRKIAGSYDGVVVFLHAMGLIIRGAVALFFYKVIANEKNDFIAVLSAALFFMISPKDFALPEYSNLQVWFGMLCFLFLIMFFRRKKTVYLVLSAFSLCLQIISYPSCVIVFAAIIFLLWKYSEKEYRIRNVITYSLICLISGIVFLLSMLLVIGQVNLAEVMQNILLQEPSHTVSPWVKLLSYIKDAGIIAGVLACITAVSFAIGYLVKKKEGRVRITEVSILISMCILLALFFINILTLGHRCFYGVLFIYMIALGLFFSKGLSSEKKRIYYSGSVLSVMGFVATLILTDLPFIVSSAYLVIAVAVSLIPLRDFYSKNETGKVKKAAGCLALVLFGLLFFRSVYVRTPLTGRAQICSILNTDLSLIRKGPAKGIITDDLGARRQVDSYDEFRENVPEGSKLWIVDSLADNLGYLYGEWQVSAPSVMSDPKYVPGLEKYWEMNPEKYPDVVALAAYEGEISYDLLKNTWITEWLENEFRPTHYVDGKFWRFYYKNRMEK